MEIKLLTNKKAQIGKKIDIVVTVIISVVVLFVLFSNLVPEAQTAGEEMSDATRCADAGCFFNETTATESGFTGDCANNASVSRLACANDVDNIPLSSLFSSSGVIILLLMVALLLGIFKIVTPGRK